MIQPQPIRLLPQDDYKAPRAQTFDSWGPDSLRLFALPDVGYWGLQVAALLANPYLASQICISQDRAFPQMDSAKASVRIHIHGYQPWDHQMNMYTTHHQRRVPLTMEKAANALAREIQRAYNDLSKWECALASLKIGAGGISFEQIYLVGVKRVSHSSIQPILFYD